MRDKKDYGVTRMKFNWKEGLRIGLMIWIISMGLIMSSFFVMWEINIPFLYVAVRFIMVISFGVFILIGFSETP